MKLLTAEPPCVCTHGIAMHAFGTRKADLGQRTACSVSSGPRGTACACASYTPDSPTTTPLTTQETS